MATGRPNPRLQVGSVSWITEEKATASQFVKDEAEEFSFSARNDLDWLNEHMAEIFSKSQVNVADIFKTPGKLRGKTPRTIRKGNPLEARLPLTDIFTSVNPNSPSPFKQKKFERPVPTFRVAEDEPEPMNVDEDEAPTSPVPAVSHQSPPKPPHNFVDSGYHGSQQPGAASQSTQATQPNDYTSHESTPKPNPSKLPIEHPSVPEVEEEDKENDENDENDTNIEILGRDSDARPETEESFQSAEEQQAQSIAEPVLADAEKESATEEDAQMSNDVNYPVLESPVQDRHTPHTPSKRLSPQRSSPAKESPRKSSPTKASPVKLSPPKQSEPFVNDHEPAVEEVHAEDTRSASDGSPSPVRPVVRKSSLNFASLPAREPITTKKSIGAGISRTSQAEPSRTSYYGRQTGGKGFNNTHVEDEKDHGDDEPAQAKPDEMDVDEDEGNAAEQDDMDAKAKRLHNQTSTQRLQDQISKLGQSQGPMRTSKSIPGNAALPPVPASQAPPIREQAEKSSARKSRPPPGAFPDDEEDSWIGPPPAAVTGTAAAVSVFSPRPQVTKSYTTDVMEDIHGKDSIGGPQFTMPKRGSPVRHVSPVREPTIPERTTSTLGHGKSISTSVLPSPQRAQSPVRKPVSVSNPTPSFDPNDAEASTTPTKPPSRTHRGSPLKAAKDKFSSILKTSRGLFASSAAVSAEAKTSALSHIGQGAEAYASSLEDTLAGMNRSPTASHAPSNKSQISLHLPDSPFKTSPRKTRASVEREEKRKQEEARLAKEAKEAQKRADQLDKARNKVKDDARVFHQEKERVAMMQKEVEARNDQEQQGKGSQVDLPRATGTSPRKTKAQLEAEGVAAAAVSTNDLASRDVEMTEVSHAMPPPAIPRPKSQIGRPGPKRPLKPAKETASKVKPPTVIRVDTGSQRGHHQHPSNVSLSASLQQDSLASSQASGSTQGHRQKASTSSVQSKSSTSSFKSAASKALEAAARKKEQDELVAQRKREAKLDIERQRAAIKEEERRKEELQRKQELERQREIQKERERAASIADAKKTVSRQAIEKRRLEMEKAKETRAPPPAARSQPTTNFGGPSLQEKALPPIPAQRSEFGQSQSSRTVPSAQRQQDERPVNPATGKLSSKRILPQDNDDQPSRPPFQRNGPSYHQQEPQSKRRKTSEEIDDEEDMTENLPKMTAPPIRQSSSRPQPKEVLTKSLFPSGYANVPPPNNLQRSTVMNQHNMNQSKPVHPLDMAQVSKAPILFAASTNQANHKTPARPGAINGHGKSAAKSAAKSSPQYQNGENIVLPDIHTDSEEEDDDNGDFVAADWTNSPDLRRRLMHQETMDPTAVFGLPGPLNMEEVFSKNKDRHHKFRNRTSSANWSGSDRLTEEEIKKDLRARDQVRRQGGWTYDTMV